jgi:hypothetical protein
VHSLGCVVAGCVKAAVTYVCPAKLRLNHDGAVYSCCMPCSSLRLHSCQGAAVNRLAVDEQALSRSGAYA